MPRYVYARGGGGGSQQREVADGADVVLTNHRCHDHVLVTLRYVTSLWRTRPCTELACLCLHLFAL